MKHFDRNGSEIACTSTREEWLAGHAAQEPVHVVRHEIALPVREAS